MWSYLRELSGNFSAVARALGVTRAAVSKFVNQRPKLKAVADECRETFVDNVESAIYKQALDGNVTAQIFILKTLGKSRGYIEKHQLEHSGHIDVTQLSDEELRRIVNSKS
jgi:predicted transcriptional regulator